MDTIRTFVAGDYTDKLKTDMVKAFTGLNLDPKGLSPQPSDKLHITFRFFGHLRISDLDKLIHVTERVALDSTPISLNFTKPIIFGGKARVLGLAPSDESGLQEMFELLNDALELSGVASRELRRFRPHITLARVKNGLTPENEEKFLTWQPDFKVEMDTLTIFESKLQPGGSIYSPLQKFSLA